MRDSAILLSATLRASATMRATAPMCASAKSKSAIYSANVLDVALLLQKGSIALAKRHNSPERTCALVSEELSIGVLTC